MACEPHRAIISILHITACFCAFSGVWQAHILSKARLDLAKEELLTFEGEIEEVLPDGRFRVLLDNDHRLIAYTAGKMRRYRIRTVAGDRVHVEMTPYDLSKGRITFRERTPGQGPGGPRGRQFRR